MKHEYIQYKLDCLEYG